MSEYQQTVKASFEGMDTEEILHRINTGTLTTEAKVLASEVLEGRKAELKQIVDRSIAAKHDSEHRGKIESAVSIAERLPLPPTVRARLWRKAFWQSLVAYAVVAVLGIFMWWLYKSLQPGHVAVRVPIKFIWALPFLPLVLLLLPVIIYFDEKKAYIRERMRKVLQ